MNINKIKDLVNIIKYGDKKVKKGTNMGKENNLKAWLYLLPAFIF